jgi:hypothetical protein
MRQPKPTYVTPLVDFVSFRMGPLPARGLYRFVLAAIKAMFSSLVSWFLETFARPHRQWDEASLGRRLDAPHLRLLHSVRSSESFALGLTLLIILSPHLCNAMPRIE